MRRAWGQNGRSRIWTSCKWYPLRHHVPEIIRDSKKSLILSREASTSPQSATGYLKEPEGQKRGFKSSCMFSTDTELPRRRIAKVCASNARL